MSVRTSSTIAVHLFCLICLTIPGIITSKGIAGDETPDVQNYLYLDPATRDFSDNSELLERVMSGPHGYFRFINIPFSEEICRRFGDILSGTPSLNLHGDAHIEQYAITDLGRGLTDYDDSSTGPGIIDLMRFGVSLHLACRENGWREQADQLYGEFLQSYRKALKNPQYEAPEPTVVKRIRDKFTINRKAYFQWVTSQMEPISGGERDSLLTAMKPYIATKLAEDSTLNEAYFNVVTIGRLRMGIGSALDRKYLLRVRGTTDDSLDDVVLEIKEVRDLRGIDCINTGQELDAFRILLGQTRIAYQPFHHLGYFRFRNLNFWVHSWVDNYKEVKIGKSFRTPEELAEVARDIGVQLGLGHVKHIAAPLDLQLRREQLRFLNKYEKRIRQEAKGLVAQTVAAWEQFCKKVKVN